MATGSQDSSQATHRHVRHGHHVLALSGGVGGAKLALGLSEILAPEELTIVANTADDFEHLGLNISPDLDTVMYTLAKINNTQQGWGLAGESWNALEALKTLGAEDWFQLGDRDIATHIARSSRLRKGDSLSSITSDFCRALGVKHRLVPMTDDSVRTLVNTPGKSLAFQHYFVRERCEPVVTGFYFEGVEQARPQTHFRALLQSTQLAATIICPSNPFVSVEPILRLIDVRQSMKQNRAPVIAVSPIVAGRAIKGPTAKMMGELNMPVSALSVATYYGDLLDGFIIDESDDKQFDAIEALGIKVLTAPTVMHNLNDKVALAKVVLSFARQLDMNETGEN